ncbi:MAG: signal peptidase I [Planctomycetota bacterium]|nr:signal peptidase I [Planctomycetota bacterium]MDP6940454.1 signal peptidase I [Planctomycetota bacterium]
MQAHHQNIALKLSRNLSVVSLRVLGLSLLLFGPAMASYRLAPVHGASMEPTLWDGQSVVYRESTDIHWRPRRGQVVVFHSPTEPGHRYVKRLIGLPGDEIKISRGTVWVNGKKAPLPPSAIEADQYLATRVPEGSFFALGDHAKVSFDSRSFGPVAMSNLVGPLVYPRHP